MEQLLQKKFNGIRQVSKTTFDTMEPKDGYLWFVKDTNGNGIYFGSQLYATTDASSISIESPSYNPGSRLLSDKITLCNSFHFL